MSNFVISDGVFQKIQISLILAIILKKEIFFSSSICGTIDYMAPEIITKSNYDHKVDIWSLGIILYELLHGKVPFDGNSIPEKCKNILKNPEIAFDYQISPKVKDLIQRILQKNPKERIEFSEIFAHPWMQTFENIYKIKLQNYVYNTTTLNTTEGETTHPYFRGDSLENKANNYRILNSMSKKETFYTPKLIKERDQSENLNSNRSSMYIPDEVERKSNFLVN